MSILSPPTLHDGHRWRGMRIGLLGGSFNPAHSGHRHIARLALAAYNLDVVWWLVTPQNPLKDRADMMAYDKRFASVEAIIAGHPRMMATHIESMLGTTYTFDTLKMLKKYFPNTHFTFICGMDNALIFHKWERWRDIPGLAPVAFIARPPAKSLVKNCPVRMIGGKRQILWMRDAKMLDISSTKIRKMITNTKT